MLDMKIKAMIEELTQLNLESLDYEKGLRKMEIQALESQVMNIELAKICKKQKEEIIELLNTKKEFIEYKTKMELEQLSEDFLKNIEG